MTAYRIYNAQIVNEGEVFTGEIFLENGIIVKILRAENTGISHAGYEQIDARGKYLIPGVIDDQVHFREPGLTHKGDIASESRAAVAGGVTSFMEMPNTNPQTLTQELLQKKYDRASDISLANYSFYMGVSNENISEVLKTDPKNVCGIKVFMGASTGNMLVDNRDSLTTLFKEAPVLIATHCEDELIIKQNSALYCEKYGEDVPVEFHPDIRSREACLKSSSLAVELATKYNSRLHLLHLSTSDELSLLDNSRPVEEKQITSEVCVHHLWFSREDYKRKGTYLKWNPAVKEISDREALWEGLLNGKLDIIATDHAPHTRDEKNQTYFKAPSGGPLIQHSLPVMLECVRNGRLSINQLVEKMCHLPAILFQIERRGFIREGYFADLVLIDTQSEWIVSQENILYKCKWSPFEGDMFHSKITHTFVNGNLVYHNEKVDEQARGMRLTFNR